MSARKTLMLCLALAVVACRDVITTEPTLQVANLRLLLGYWAGTDIYSAPASVIGLSGNPVNGCVGDGFGHVALDTSLPKSMQDTIFSFQMDMGLVCPDVRFNSYSWVLSFITPRAPGFGYPITINADTMLFVGTFTDSNHLSGKIVLAIAGTQIGTWSRERLVPGSSAEKAARAKLDSLPKDMKPGSYRIIRTGRYALP
jgi:hypothetical protein